MTNLNWNTSQLLLKNVEQKHLKESTEERLIYGYNEGLFNLDPSFIAFVSIITVKKCPIFDMYGTPIMIDDVPAFYRAVKSRYFETANDVWTSWQEVDKRYK